MGDNDRSDPGCFHRPGILFGLAGLSAGSGLIGLIVTATVGALVLLYLIRLVKRA